MRRLSDKFHGLLSFDKVVFAAIALVVLGSSWGTPARAQDTSINTTQAQPVQTNTTQPVSKHKPIFLTFTRTGPATEATPDATFSCNVGYPTVTSNFTTNEVQWSATITCSLALGLNGTTVLFDYPSGPNVAYGNQINTTAASATSAGYAYVSNGNYEVNFNIIITPPAGYTTTVGGYCYYLSGNTQVECNVPSGEFQME